MPADVPYGQLLTIRPEVFEPHGLVSVVDLSVVTGRRRRSRRKRTEVGDAQAALLDPDRFFDITYPTHEIVQTLQLLAKRMTEPQAVPGTILLAGHYGSGKSHVMLAAHHALTAPDVAQAWATRWSLPPLDLPEDPLVLTRSFIQRAEGALWDVLLEALDHGEVPASAYVDGEHIEAILPDRPVVLILDELERWYDAQDASTQSRNRNFLQALTEVSMRHPRLTVLTSVLGEHPEPGDTIRRVKPLELGFKSSQDRERVVQYRLFADRMEEPARRAATEVAQAYGDAYRAAGLDRVDELQASLQQTWPFTPELMDILTKKVPAIGGFMNTRGVLRFLAHILRATHDRRPVVSSQDLPLADDDVRNTLKTLAPSDEIIRRALGDNYEAVPDDLPHKDSLFSALVLYSVADPGRPGATDAEILTSVLDPGENPVRIRDSLNQLKQVAFNLHVENDRYLFKAAENPHARITAMARSGAVTSAAIRSHIEARLLDQWGDRRRTALYDGDKDALRARLREIRGQRPRFVLSTKSLQGRGRLHLQNLDEDRNVVLLVEPLIRSAGTTYRLFSDEQLIHHARRFEACRLLLESSPNPEAAAVYRSVRDKEQHRLQKAIQERYGSYISWNRAGPDTSDVDDSWYEVNRLKTLEAAAFLQQVRVDHSSADDIAYEVGELWEDFKHQTVEALSVHFDRTPGLPVPYDAALVPGAVRRLAKEGVLGLMAQDGKPVASRDLDGLDTAALLACTFVAPGASAGVEQGPETLLTHPRAAGRWDDASKAIRLQWSYPEPPPGEVLRTLVQRYTSAREWAEGQAYAVGIDQTHDANRYLGDGEHFEDTEGVRPGEWYHYYVFLEHQRPGKPSRFVLSRRIDVGVPKEVAPPPPGEITIPPQPSQQKLVAAVERALLAGGRVPADAVLRKVEVTVRGVVDAALRTELAPKLEDRAAGALEASADLFYAARGAWNRTGVLDLVRAVPRFEQALYEATLTLQVDPSEAD